MTRRVVTVTRDAPLTRAIALLIENGISGVPVVDDQNRLVGLISKTDLLISSGLEAARTVADAMTPLALSVGERVSIGRAAALMAAEGVHRVVVTSDTGAVVGILSSIDVMAWLARQEGYMATR